MNDGVDLTMFHTDKIGREVLGFIHFSEVLSPVGFIKFVTAERNGMEVPKQTLNIPRSSLVHKWLLYEQSNDDYLQKALKSLNSMETLLDSSTYLLIDRFNLLLSKKHGRQYHKHVFIFAAELLNISPAAYRMVKRSEIIILPDEKMIRGLLTKSLSDDNLEKLFEKLKPERKLVNILLDEVKLKQAIRFIGSISEDMCLIKIMY